LRKIECNTYNVVPRSSLCALVGCREHSGVIPTEVDVFKKFSPDAPLNKLERIRDKVKCTNDMPSAASRGGGRWMDKVGPILVGFVHIRRRYNGTRGGGSHFNARE
jgi:hypothetical protein